MSTGDDGPIDIPSLFHDVEPIPQDDGPTPVCSINYSFGFKEAMNYFRAVLLANERSERALKLTTVCLKHNPANYTTWHFRRECLAALSNPTGSSDGKPKFSPEAVEKDLRLASDMGGSNPKNYQIWYHRRALLEPTLLASSNKHSSSSEQEEKRRCVAREELSYISNVLEEDGKNYHAWSQRQWVMRCFSSVEHLWKDELDFAHSLILKDPRNNSAWNHRWFAAHRGTNVAISLDTATDESEYAIQGAEIDPYNESPLRYLIGIINEQIRLDKVAAMDLVKDAEIKVKSMSNGLVREKQTQKEHGEEDMDEVVGGVSSNLISAQIDLLQAKGDAESMQQAAELAHALGTEHDTIRFKYWTFREKELRSKLVDSIS